MREEIHEHVERSVREQRAAAVGGVEVPAATGADVRVPIHHPPLSTPGWFGCEKSILHV